LVATAGTTTVICVSDHESTAGAPLVLFGVLNVMVLLPSVAPNPFPLTATSVPTGPLVGDNPVMSGGVGIVKSMFWLLPTPLVNTRTGPVLAETGTVATICVSLQ